MIKSSAERLADRQLSYGWYHGGASVAYAFCPTCRKRCEAAVVAWANERERIAAVREALVSHLRHECDEVSS